MKTMFAYILSWSLLSSVAAQQNRTIKIDTITLSRHFPDRGYTTAGAYTHFDNMATNNTPMQVVSTADKMMIEEILREAKEKRHLQQKLGTQNMFFLVKFSGDTVAHRFIISAVSNTYSFFGKPIGKVSIIIDLTRKKEYHVTDKNDLNRLSAFRSRMQKGD